jgi:hypothetical protein
MQHKRWFVVIALTGYFVGGFTGAGLSELLRDQTTNARLAAIEHYSKKANSKALDSYELARKAEYLSAEALLTAKNAAENIAKAEASTPQG